MTAGREEGWWTVADAPGPVVAGPEDAVARLGWLRGLGQEGCGMLVVDGRGREVASGLVSLGTHDHTFMSPFEIVGRVLGAPGGAGAWLAHNHPSGDPSPSREDAAVWRRVASAGRVVGVSMHDALVVAGEQAWWSLRAGRGEASHDDRGQVVSPESAIALLDGRPREPGTVRVLACDQRHRLLDVSTWPADAPGWSRRVERQVLRQAVAKGAPALLVVADVDDHRRVGLDLVDAANRLESGAATLGVRVLDVIAHGPDGYASLARRNQLGSSLTSTLPRRTAQPPLPPPPARTATRPAVPVRAAGR